jgi:hypothetical protein
MNEQHEAKVHNLDHTMILDPCLVLRSLTTSAPVYLNDLPQEHGIYALHDHTGAIRYIGITKADKHGFRGRINNRHASGSEGRSHKFSHAYNTGRMWRAKRDSRPDAAWAKRLRTAFIRRHCRATFVVVPRTLWGGLLELESVIKAMAPQGMDDWGNRRDFVCLSEPNDLVDALLNELRFTFDQRAAVERQAALHAAGYRRHFLTPN